MILSRNQIYSSDTSGYFGNAFRARARARDASRISPAKMFLLAFSSMLSTQPCIRGVQFSTCTANLAET